MHSILDIATNVFKIKSICFRRLSTALVQTRMTKCQTKSKKLLLSLEMELVVG